MQGVYKFVAKKDDDMACVCITDGGEFDGVIYKYGAVTIPDKFDDKGNLPFRFEYEIIDNYDIPKEKFNEKFFNLIECHHSMINFIFCGGFHLTKSKFFSFWNKNWIIAKSIRTFF